MTFEFVIIIKTLPFEIYENANNMELNLFFFFSLKFMFLITFPIKINAVNIKLIFKNKFLKLILLKHDLKSACAALVIKIKLCM